MLQRLYQSLLKGPSLNAKPHHSRQRMDMADFRFFESFDEGSEHLVDRLLQRGKLEISARVEPFIKPPFPEQEWSDEQKDHRDRWSRQSRLLRKLAAIAADAKEYFNDHGEDALFVSYPLLSLPPSVDGAQSKSSRILAPLAMIPVTLKVRVNSRPGITLELLEDGVDQLIANPALLSWIEQNTGEDLPDLFTDTEGEDPWREMNDILRLLNTSLAQQWPELSPEQNLESVPRTNKLPNSPSILNAAVLGLFPMMNRGLMRDTKWMIDTEPCLIGPIRSFLKKEAIFGDVTGRDRLPELEEKGVAEQAAYQRAFGDEYLITRADPCQASAVTEASRSQALVIHGPPGTGKSQTIANIIGDHLARGEKVLFVCDKRTALDVVKYRLDALGIGDLVGVIHDPQRDRRDFYMGLRQQLEDMSERSIPRNPQRALTECNRRLETLHSELRQAYAAIHQEDEMGESFHDVLGRWLELGGAYDHELPEEAISFEQVQHHRSDLREVLERAGIVDVDRNVLFRGMTVELDDYLTESAGNAEEDLAQLVAVLRKLPTRSSGSDDVSISAITLPTSIEMGHFKEVAKQRRSLADYLEQLQAESFDDISFRAVLGLGGDQAWVDEWQQLAQRRKNLDHALDRELMLQLQPSGSKNWPAMGALNEQIVKLENYQTAMQKWTHIFAFSAKKEAAAVLSAYALQLGKENTERVHAFLSEVKSRIILNDFILRVRGEGEDSMSDEQLRQALEAMAVAREVKELLEEPCLQQTLLYDDLLHSKRLQEWSERILQSAERADILEQWLGHYHQSKVLTTERTTLFVEQLANDVELGAAGQLADEIERDMQTLESLLRMERRLDAVPGNLQAAVLWSARRADSPDEGYLRIEWLGLHCKLIAMFQRHAELAEVDTIRVNAAFVEFRRKSS